MSLNIEFPDIESLLLKELERFGTTTLLTQENLYDEDLSDLPNILISSFDGDQYGIMHRLDYCAIIVAAPGRDEAFSVAEDIRRFMVPGPVCSTEGLLDRVRCTQTPRWLPQKMDALAFVQADYSIETRGFVP